MLTYKNTICLEALVSVEMFPSLELDICDRNAVDMIYNNLIYGTSLLSFNFQKRMVFKSLPASIANQKLCFGQPIKPFFDASKDSSQHQDAYQEAYQDAYVKWKLEHFQNGGCFRCKVNISNEEIIDYEEVEDFSQFLYLPKFIYSQYLFEDEPVNLPSTVEEFYNYYVCDGAETFETCGDKQNVINYFNNSLSHYKEQLQLWKSRLSKSKMKRYEEYCRQRDFYNLQ